MSPRPGPAVRRATAADVPAIARSLARAFRDDPVFRWLFPLGHSRVARNEAFFALELRRVHLRHNEVWTAGDGAAAALWDPPGTWKVPLPTLLRSGPELLRLLGARTPIGLLGLSRVESRHPTVPHWYLAILGTAPDHQGRGLASAALAPVLARCDAEGTAAYLETATPENVPFYERHGFAVTGEVTLPRGPYLWLMTRQPRRGGGSPSTAWTSGPSDSVREGE
jgi:GNAT superfamily N-acetyltransferase